MSLSGILVEETMENHLDSSKTDLSMLEGAEVQQEAVEEEVQAPEGALDSALDGDDIPDKFKGKTVKDLLDSYTNLESYAGRLNQEVGTYRQQKAQPESTLQDSTPAQPVSIDTSELLENPTNAIEKIVADRTAAATKAAEDRVAQLQRELSWQSFESRHQNYQQDAATEDFRAWVQQAPHRHELAVAASGRDGDAAMRLMDEYQVTGNVATAAPVADVVTEQGKKGAQAASLETTSNNAVSAPGKIYSKAKIMELRLTNPDKYHDPGYQQEIVQAYAEGRVK